MRHADRPEIEVSVRVAAAPEAVWPWVSDIATPVHGSDELLAARWIGDGPAVGSTFTGTNRNEFFGQWDTTCTVTEYDPPHAFGWTVGELDEPNTSWRFVLVPDADGTVVTQRARLGYGPSGLHVAIAARPDKEERIVERRLEQWRASMNRTLEYVKARAEA